MADGALLQLKNVYGIGHFLRLPCLIQYLISSLCFRQQCLENKMVVILSSIYTYLILCCDLLVSVIGQATVNALEI